MEYLKKMTQKTTLHTYVKTTYGYIKSKLSTLHLVLHKITRLGTTQEIQNNNVIYAMKEKTLREAEKTDYRSAFGGYFPTDCAVLIEI